MATDRPTRASRREFLATTGSGVLLGPAIVRGAGIFGRPRRDRIRVAAILTEFTYRSHAHVILENFLGPYLFNGERVDPQEEFEVVSIYLDQTPARDMGRQIAKEAGIPVVSTIADALTRSGGGLAVDAVLSIGEHGDYPVNAKGQREYPRKRFFDEITAVFERTGQVAPVFNDKHLSYRWDWAKAMYDTAKRMKFPLMAGSSVPLAQRRPPVEIPEGASIPEAVSIHGGPIESYDFHGLEVLQSMVEARKGGETGIESVTFLEGDALWDGADAGLWSPELASAALDAEVGVAPGMLKDRLRRPPFDNAEPHAILLKYRDGLRGAILQAGYSGIRWDFACRLGDAPDPLATSFYVGPWENRNLFKALAHAIQSFFRTGKAPYPVERTLLTTGALDAAMDSRLAGGNPVETPQLAIAYEPTDYRPFREMGATWEIVTEETPQPRGLDPTGASHPRPD